MGEVCGSTLGCEGQVGGVVRMEVGQGVLRDPLRVPSEGKCWGKKKSGARGAESVILLTIRIPRQTFYTRCEFLFC